MKSKTWLIKKKQSKQPCHFIKRYTLIILPSGSSKANLQVNRFSKGGIVSESQVTLALCRWLILDPSNILMFELRKLYDSHLMSLFRRFLNIRFIFWIWHRLTHFTELIALLWTPRLLEFDFQLDSKQKLNMTNLLLRVVKIRKKK